MRRIVLIAAASTAVFLSVASGQNRFTIRTAVLSESYSFDPGLVFKEISELTIPVRIDIPVGRFANLALSTGYVSVDLKSAVDESLLSDQLLSGVLDTQARLSVDVAQGRLVILATGTIPTGTRSVQRGELAILGALASDVIGFSAASVGGSGDVGGGFAGAVPVGRFALGFGASYRQPFSYMPVLGLDTLLRQGAEMKARVGLQGPLARRTYLRVTLIYAMRQKDQVAAETRHGVGNRFVGYVAINQGVGPASLTLYGFDVFRGDPQVEPTAAGAAILPRGNLLALGARLVFPMGSQTSLTPRFESRISATAVDRLDTTLRRAGNTMRIGADLRRSLTRTTAIVLQCDGVFGNVVQLGADVGLRGFRVGLHLEITR